MSNPTEITELFQRYLEDACTTAEIKRLLAYFEAGDNEALLKPLISAALENGDQPGTEVLQPLLNETFASIRQQIAPGKSGNFFGLFSLTNRRIRYAAAAVLVGTIGISGWLLYRSNRLAVAPGFVDLGTTPAPEPGGNKALLRLSDGRVIVLDSAANGSLGLTGMAQIVKTDGLVVFSADHTSEGRLADAASQTNSISTPRGGQYQIILPDGSKVWLNAATSLKFPTNFSSNERTVEVNGEAYFEIAADASRPFYVNTHDMQVQVMGTRFNVNAYEDEPQIKTTLLEGKVKINSEANSRILQPGQQSVITKLSSGSEIAVRTANADEVIAWKNGLFVFNNAGIMTIMRQIARWYDVTIKWDGDPPSDEFTGEVSRNSRITEVLKILELNNIHTKLEGKTLTLMP